MRPESMFELAGANIAISAESATAMQHLEWFFGAALRTPPGRDLETIRIEIGRALVARPPVVCDSSDGPVERWNDLECVRLWHDSGRGAEVTTQQITIGASVGEDAEAWRSARQLLAEALAIWFGGQGALVIHAAHIGIGDAGLIALGPTGRGKSTIAATALAGGWDVHGDDLAIVQHRAGEADAHGIPKRPSFDPHIACGTELPLEPDERDSRGRLTTSTRFMTSGWTKVRAIVKLAHDSGPGMVCRIAHADALNVLIASAFGVHDGRQLAHHLPTLAAMASLPAYQIGLAASPDRRLDHALETLRWIWTDIEHRTQDSSRAD